jgi:hypothetical protein
MGLSHLHNDRAQAVFAILGRKMTADCGAILTKAKFIARNLSGIGDQTP